ncbi:class I adenylate-forming enzyme family protein [Actinoplanes sp. NPDC020271]|uniref:class I adenylate-forming enzyme family protein n=1 Tax=Actinoplanes sp. NPDC020271 TaxID=3363896 RepID=UPI0037B8359F
MTAPVLLHDLLDLRAAATPEATALTRSERSWTYRHLAGWSCGAARWLAAAGVGRGDRVLIVGANEAAVVALAYGASRIGAVFVVVSDQVSEFHLRHILGDSEAPVVIANGTAWPVASSIDGARAYRLDEVAEYAIENSWAFEAGAPGSGISSDPVCFIYTSGSTGLPKAVVSTHRQVLFAAAAIQSRLGYRADDTVLCCLPLSFDYGLYQVFLSTIAGARLVLGNDADAGPALLNRLVDQDVTVLPLVPSLAVTLCRLAARGGRQPSLLRMVTNTGADLSAGQCARLREAIPGLQVFAMFGLTECKRVSIAEPDLDLTRPGSVGRPLPDTEVLILDEDGRAVPAGEPGELVVRGPHVMAGYWKSPELNARRYRRDAFGTPMLFTGDRARVDADGYLYFLGRDDDVFKQRGVRVSTTEIEAAALDIPGVEMAAALPGRDGQDARLAVCTRLELPELTEALKARLGAQKMPPTVRVTERIPLGVNGKVDKKALAADWDTAVSVVPVAAGATA